MKAPICVEPALTVYIQLAKAVCATATTSTISQTNFYSQRQYQVGPLANSAFDSDYPFFVKNKREVLDVPAADLVMQASNLSPHSPSLR